jgi:hypothetical protein
MIEEPGQVVGLLAYGAALRIAGFVVTRLLLKAGDVARPTSDFSANRMYSTNRPGDCDNYQVPITSENDRKLR